MISANNNWNMEHELHQVPPMLYRLIITVCLMALATPCWAEGYRSSGSSIPPIWTMKKKAPKRPVINFGSKVKVTIVPGCDRQWLWFPLGAEGEAGH